MSLQPYNQKPLNIKTFDGFNSPYHPSVLFFEDGWNGWKYWMAETPFSPQCTPYRDRNECPSIHVSNDGIEWTEISTNPISDLSDEDLNNLDYLSDPHLVKKGNLVECFFRHTHRYGNADDFSDVTILKSYSKDGKLWSTPQIVLNPSYSVVSPAIIYRNDYGYQMWYVDSESHYHQRNICLRTSIDGMAWSDPVMCVLRGKDVNPWHIDVQIVDGYLYLTIYDFQNITLWRSKIENPHEFEYVQTILSPAEKKYGSFYSNGLYRACLVDSDKGLELYFSADDSKQTFIGRVLCYRKEINHAGTMQFNFATAKGKNSNFRTFLTENLYGYKRWGCFVARNLYRRIFR